MRTAQRSCMAGGGCLGRLQLSLLLPPHRPTGPGRAGGPGAPRGGIIRGSGRLNSQATGRSTRRRNRAKSRRRRPTFARPERSTIFSRSQTPRARARKLRRTHGALTNFAYSCDDDDDDDDAEAEGARNSRRIVRRKDETISLSLSLSLVGVSLLIEH